jgi:AAA domain
MSATFNPPTSSAARRAAKLITACDGTVLDRLAEEHSAAYDGSPAKPANDANTVFGPGDDAMVAGTSYFARNRQPQPDVVENLLGESKITVLGGDYGVGKSPLIADLVLHIVNGLEWCGRAVEKRPIIHFDFETPAQKYKADLENGAKRLGIPVPPVPEMLQPLFQNDDIAEPGTAQLFEALESDDKGFALVEKLLIDKPTAVLIFDPVELFVLMDKKEGKAIVGLYRRLRRLFANHPHASVLCTFNLKKADRKAPKPNLLAEPRRWLDDVSGAKEIMSRSDIRLGIDFFDDEQIVRVINGVQRGEPFDPLLIQPAGEPEAGFELCPPIKFSLNDVLTRQQARYWQMLPSSFTFREGVNSGVPKSSLSRLINRARSVGLLRQEKERWTKTVGDHGDPGKLEPVN